MEIYNICWQKMNSLKRYIYSKIIAKKFHKVGIKFRIDPYIQIKGAKYINIRDCFTAGAGMRLEAIDYYRGQRFEPQIVIGNNFSASEYCHIGAIDSIKIGNDVLMGSKVYITDHQHGTTSFQDLKISPYERKLSSKGSVNIGDSVWIGDGVVIMPGVTIGSHSVLGANSVVTKDIPPYSVAVGAPAKVIKSYLNDFGEKIYADENKLETERI